MEPPMDCGACTYSAPCRWQPTAGAAIPMDAISGGVDSSGETLYIGRTRHAGDVLPGKVVPSHEACYVAYGGAECRQEVYQILVSDGSSDFDWVPAQSGQLPSGAIQGGVTEDGERLYIGRVDHDGSTTIGKVHLSHKVCYIPYDGREVACHEYEVLVCKSINFCT